jgi:hypothetical protein
MGAPLVLTAVILVAVGTGTPVITFVVWASAVNTTVY